MHPKPCDLRRPVPLRLIDRRFRAHPLRYVFQSLLAAVAMVIALLVVDVVAHTVLVAALGSTAFVVFTMPNERTSGPRFVLGGYVIGLGAGVLTWLLFDVSFRTLGLEMLGAHRGLGMVLFGGLAVGLSIFLMVVTNTEHAPAAGAALGVVVNPQWDIRVLLVILLAVAALCLCKQLLRPVLRDLA
jgi:CBS-domain-containing membrane protein